MSIVHFNTITEYRISPMSSLELTISELNETYEFGNAVSDSSFALDDVVEVDQYGSEKSIGSKILITFYPLQNNLVEMETAMEQLKSSERVICRLHLSALADQPARRDFTITINRAGVSRSVESANGTVRMGIRVTGVIPPLPAMPPEYFEYI